MSALGKAALLDSVEERLDLRKLRVAGVDTWPFIREYCLGRWDHPNQPPPAPVLAPVLRLSGCDAKRLFGRNPTDFLVFTQEYEYVERGSLRYNFFLDPWVEELRGHFESTKIAVRVGGSASSKPLAIPEETLFPAALQVFSLLRREPVPDEFNRAKALLAEGGGPAIDLEWVRAKAESTLRWEAFFHEVLDAIHPKAVLLVCYYHGSYYGLAKACKMRGIPVLEVQHGMSVTHPFYTGFGSLPQEGMNTYPDYFCAWSEYDCAQYAPARRNSPQGAQALLTGNPWLRKYRNGNGLPLSAEESAFLKGLAAYERVAVFTLGGACNSVRLFPPHVEDAMRLSANRWMWLVRAHPMTPSAELQQVEHRLRSIPGLRWEMRLTSAIPFPSLLQHATHQFAECSSCCLEAMAFGVPAAVMNEFGRELFRDYLAAGVVHYAPDTDALLDFIRSPPPGRRPLGVFDVMASQDRLLSALRFAINRPSRGNASDAERWGQACAACDSGDAALAAGDPAGARRRFLQALQHYPAFSSAYSRLFHLKRLDGPATGGSLD
jgi:hypothetical protein